MKTFIWFKNDLRLNYNSIVSSLPLGNTAISIFILDPKLLKSKHAHIRRNAFLIESLIDLDTSLQKRGSALIVIQADPVHFWETISKKEHLTVHFSSDYTAYANTRDTAVIKLLKANGSTVETYKNSVIFDRDDELLSRESNPIKVFTPFKKAFLAKLALEKQMLKNDAVRPVFASHKENQEYSKELIQLGFEPVSLTETYAQLKTSPFFKGGEREALHLWELFKNKNIDAYGVTRDRLDLDGTSKLSPHLKFGTISPHQILSECLEMQSKKTEDGVEKYMSEIIWREFYRYILMYFPEVERNNFHEKFNTVVWQKNEKHFLAWKEGKTGYPIVDACMRQLRETGWMHNRGRMIVGSFLCKDLHIHWKEGELYFQETLVDWDRASNNGGWQWVAGTGTDAAPYFRIFNPVEQGRKFDPQGNFVKKYIPELSKVPVEYIHEPWKMSKFEQVEYGCVLDYNYPLPIIDHKAERKKALEFYKSS